MTHRSVYPPVRIMVLFFLIAGCGSGTEDKQATAEVKAETQVTEPASLPRTAAPAGARVFFVTPADGATVSNPVLIEFGIEGMALAKAGVNEPQSGHHHLIIDADLPDPSLPIPASENYVHFGDASSKTERTLAPGTHTLQLLLGDHLHIPHEPPVASEVITITVEQTVE